MNPSFHLYMSAWLFACGIAIGIVSRNPVKYGFNRSYLSFITVPWKLAVFVPAFMFVTFAGQFSFDDTWDVVNGAGMSVLTYVTAPWAVGMLFKASQRAASKQQLTVAIIAMMFSSSWFYDGWLVIRDGYYPSTWLPNLLLSPVLYLAAGLLWNLEIGEDGKASFSFFRKNWPETSSHRLSKALLIKTAPFIAIAAFILLFSVRWQFLDWSLIDLLPETVKVRLFEAF
ncbi:hypothetical protein [Rhizobium sp. MHM7A]|uniref:hypothetical protein n=1 Tax=Rhizobium sp. MHM7A TaxID=2583233 RepID=UPI001106695C|nr:hypothetical protein [Rhizobium sp. MHM7A]TLX16145.1 hypothetical protein FFR93_02130 [Rhizobium sp. MHM7A]